MSDDPQHTPTPIVVEGLRYAYKKTQALRGISLKVEHGSIHGFVGPNGAGKTTALKVLATLLKPDAGRALIFGTDVVRCYKEVRARIGFMPEQFGLYRQMTVFECLDFFGAAYGMTAGQREAVIADILELTDMTGRRDDLVNNLSRGMVQRLSLARALVHDPDLLLLDEPAAGLDPRARLELMAVLRELSRLGKTIFISSHILGEIADLCDSVTIIDRGVIRYSGSMRDLLAQRSDGGAYVLTLDAPTPRVQEALESTEGVGRVIAEEDGRTYRLRFDPEVTDTAAVLRAAIDAGGRVTVFREDLRELSQAFLQLTEPGVPS